ncbi:hypothetical protein QQP08_001804 [Theobroma cacao]|nr:hypothetical protein QQP08_001804 [Theobroma cacao]
MRVPSCMCGAAQMVNNFIRVKSCSGPSMEYNRHYGLLGSFQRESGDNNQKPSDSQPWHPHSRTTDAIADHEYVVKERANASSVAVKKKHP